MLDTKYLINIINRLEENNSPSFRLWEKEGVIHLLTRLLEQSIQNDINSIIKYENEE